MTEGTAGPAVTAVTGEQSVPAVGALRRLAASALLSALLVAAVFGGSLDADFLYWDDRLYLHDNPHLHALEPANLWWMLTDNRGPVTHYNWQPLTALSHALDIALWGFDASMHRLGNLLLHALSGVLVYCIARALLVAGQLPPARDPQLLQGAGLLAMAMFLVHPLRVESVVWIAERKDVLCGMFYLLAVCAWLQFRRAGGRAWRLLAGGAAAAACLAKPMAVSLPLVLMVLDYWPYRRLHANGAGLRALPRLLLEKLDFILFAALTSAMAILAQHRGASLAPLGDLDLLTRLLNAAHSLVFYVQKWLLPGGLVPLYPYPRMVVEQSVGAWLVLALVLAVAAGAMALARRGRRWPGALLMAYVAGLLPVLGLVQVGAQAAADRYTYLPMVGFAVLFGAAITCLWQRLGAAGAQRRLLLLAVGLTLLVFGAVARVQTGAWSSDVALWSHTLRHQPERVPAAHLNLGVALHRAGRLDEALERYEVGAALVPEGAAPPLVHYQLAALRENLAALLLVLGDAQRARALADEAAAITPGSVRALVTAAQASAKLGEADDARRRFQAVLALQPDNAEALRYLGLTDPEAHAPRQR